MSACFVCGCNPEWLEPLEDTPLNLRLGVITVGLKEDAKGKPWISPALAQSSLIAASRFWNGHCGISFVPVAHFERDARADGVAFRPRGVSEVRDARYRYSHVNYITAVFLPEFHLEKDEADENLIGLSVFPWTADRQALFISDSYDSTLAHELGHFMGLRHDEANADNVMYPDDAKPLYDQRVRPDQCELAKRYLLAHEHLRSLCRPESADPALSGDNCPPADLY